MSLTCIVILLIWERRWFSHTIQANKRQKWQYAKVALFNNFIIKELIILFNCGGHIYAIWFHLNIFLSSWLQWNICITFLLNDMRKTKVLYTMSYTVFRQAFLLIQYSFVCKQYFFCSDREYQYFFWQMLNKTADCFNNISFWLWKLVEKIYWKNGKQLNVGKDLMSV